MSVFVVDASTCLKWVLKDEDNTEVAEKILADYLAGKITLIAPNLWIYEVANGIRSALIRKRVTLLKAKKLLKLLVEAKPRLMPMEPVIQKCLVIADKYQTSIYDSVYIALALENRLPFITADKKLAVNFTSLDEYL